MSGGVADVYAGDTALSDEQGPAGSIYSCEYHIRADADPDVLCRISNQLLFSNVPPWRVVLAQTNERSVDVTVEMRSIPKALAESVRRKLLQQTCVIDVSLQPIGESR